MMTTAFKRVYTVVSAHTLSMLYMRAKNEGFKIDQVLFKLIKMYINGDISMNHKTDNHEKDTFDYLKEVKK